MVDAASVDEDAGSILHVATLIVSTFPSNQSSGATTSSSKKADDDSSAPPKKPADEQPAQKNETPPSAVSLTALKSRIGEIENDAALDEAIRKKALEAYRQAVLNLEQAATLEAATQQYQRDVQSAPAELERVERQIAAAPAEPIVETDADAPLEQMQQRLVEAEATLSGVQAEKAAVDAALELRLKRRRDVPQEIANARSELTKLSEQLLADPDGEDADVAARAARALAEARKRKLERQIRKSEQEIAAYDATDKVQIAKRDLAARKVSNSQKLVERHKDRVDAKRLREAAAQAVSARDAVDDVPVVLKSVAEANARLAETLAELNRQLTAEEKQARLDVVRVQRQKSRLEAEFEALKQRSETLGFTDDLGVLLRQHRNNLPDAGSLRRRIADRSRRTARAELQRIGYRTDRTALADLESEIERQFTELNVEANDDSQLERKLRRLLEARQDYLDGVVRDLTDYDEQLLRLDALERMLLTQTEAQADYIAEHILWVRSTTPVDAATAWNAWDALKWLAAGTPALGRVLVADVTNNTLIYALVFPIFAALLLRQYRLRTDLKAASEEAARKHATSFRPTVRAAALTLLLAMLWPATLAFLGWRLNVGSGWNEFEAEANGAGRFARTVGAALATTAVVWLSLDVFRRVCRKNGLADSHFRWPERAVGALRVALRWFVPSSLLLIVLNTVARRSGNDDYQASLGRIALVAVLLLLSLALHQILRKKGGVVAETIARNREGWLYRTRWIWYPLGIGVPLALAAAALSGYLYTAQQLVFRLLCTLWLVLGLIILNALVKRWLLLTYRRLAIRQAQERRAAAQSAAEAQAAPEVDATITLSEAPAVDLSESNVQTGNLVRLVFGAALLAGLWWIWAEVLPALGVLRQVELWKSGAATGAEAEWITLAEALLAGVVLIVTLAAGRNLPGLLEMTVLQRLPIDAGARYATSTVCRYMIAGVGFVVVFRLLGVNWESVQWLIAAMSVGLGFGLQEIFANFVSGLILLFERPIRVGDTVTVGGVTGTVTRIRIRATTVIDWDRKELVMPNREFVTGELVNWTLSDAVLRVVVRVGVAYGSDTRLTSTLLEKVARENSNVLKDPQPQVMFLAFGSSSLDFELRVFVPSLILYRTIANDLNRAIDDEFRKAGIEIAFPQRDLHIRSMPERVQIENVHDGRKDWQKD